MSTIKSQLHKRSATIRGMGEGIPENQRVLGVENPEQAAKTAVSQSNASVQDASVIRRVDQMVAAMEDGFTPSLDPEWAAGKDSETFDRVYQGVC